MGTPTEAALELRLEKRERQIADLKAQASRERALLQGKKKKKETQRKIENGGLVKIAELDEVDEGLLLGVLLDAAERLQEADPATKHQWQQHGARVLVERGQKRGKSGKMQPVAQEQAVTSNGIPSQTHENDSEWPNDI